MIPHDPGILHRLIFWSEVAGAITTFGGIVLAVINWFKTISSTNKNVNLMVTNHLPHLQDAVTAHAAALEGLKTDMKLVDTKISGVSERVGGIATNFQTLETAFINHLENLDKEESKKRKGKKRKGKKR